MAYWPWQGYEGDPGWEARKGAFIQDGSGTTTVPEWLSGWNALQERRETNRAFWQIVDDEDEDEEYDEEDW